MYRVRDGGAISSAIRRDRGAISSLGVAVSWLTGKPRHDSLPATGVPGTVVRVIAMARNCFKYEVATGIGIESDDPSNGGPTLVHHGVRVPDARQTTFKLSSRVYSSCDQCPGCIRYRTAVTTASQRKAVTRTRMVLSRLLHRRFMRAYTTRQEK